MSKRGYTPSVLPEEEAVIWGEDGGNPLTPVQYQLFGLLRRSIDRKTGIAGERSHISNRGLYERLYQPSSVGFAGTGNQWGETSQQRIAFIKGQLKTLEKRGLIKRLSTGKKLVISFPIFVQVRDSYFSGQNIYSPFTPPVYSLSDTVNDVNENSGLGGNEANDSGGYSPDDSGIYSPYPEVSRSKDTTTAGGEIWKSDPIAAAMLAGGMNEYHVATTLHFSGNWRKLDGYCESSAITLIKARLARNPNVKTVNYFTGAIQQMCANAMEPTNGKSYPTKRYAGRQESAGDRLEAQARRLGIVH